MPINNIFQSQLQSPGSLQSQGTIVGFTIPVTPTGYASNSIMTPSQNPTFNNLDFQQAVQDGAITSISLQYLNAAVIKGGTISGVSLTIGQNFSVSQSGQMTATGALIGSGTITGGSISIGSDGFGNPVFSVDTSGLVTLSSGYGIENLHMRAGKIVFTDTSDSEIGYMQATVLGINIETTTTDPSNFINIIGSKGVSIYAHEALDLQGDAGVAIGGSLISLTGPVSIVNNDLTLTDGSITLTTGGISMAAAITFLNDSSVQSDGQLTLYGSTGINVTANFSLNAGFVLGNSAQVSSVTLIGYSGYSWLIGTPFGDFYVPLWN